jgi:hypothetical protein
MWNGSESMTKLVSSAGICLNFYERLEVYEFRSRKWLNFPITCFFYNFLFNYSCNARLKDPTPLNSPQKLELEGQKRGAALKVVL